MIISKRHEFVKCLILFIYILFIYIELNMYIFHINTSSDVIKLMSQMKLSEVRLRRYHLVVILFLFNKLHFNCSDIVFSYNISMT